MINGKECKWTITDLENKQTECGGILYDYCEDFKYCPYCGGKIIMGTKGPPLPRPIPKTRRKNKSIEVEEELYNADPNCKHVIKQLMSGVKCTKCSGWFCF